MDGAGWFSPDLRELADPLRFAALVQDLQAM